MERLFDGQLLVKTQEVTKAPSHGEGFIPEHGQGRLNKEIGTQKEIRRNASVDFFTLACSNKSCTTDPGGYFVGHISAHSIS